MTVTASEAARSNGNGKSNGNGQHAEQSEAADETGEGPSLEQLDAYVRDHFFTPAELAAGFPDPGFLIDQLIPARGVLMFVGEPGAGKTFAAYDLVRAVATNTPWLGRSAMPQGAPFASLVINYDNDPAEVAKRFRLFGVIDSPRIFIHTVPPGRKADAQGEYKGFPEDYRLRNLDDEENSNVEAVVECISTVAKHVGARLVIFDSLRQAHTGKEQDSQQMSVVMSAFKRISLEIDGPVIVIHHTAKGDTNWQSATRGSGEIDASSELVVHVQKEEMKWTKVRGWPGEGQILKIRWEADDESLRLIATGNVPGVRGEESDTRAAVRVLEAEGRKLGLKELREALKATEDSFTRCIEYAQEHKLLTVERESRRTQKRLVGLPGWGKYGPNQTAP
ncbi:MAG TPA: AAA family ATPase [Gemmatimonadaceae bacterium]|nr:AAA family ATPase [Gemmatimonadaceae bacterium]